MELKKARDSYDYFSSKASDVSRQLSFAGIAVVWLFAINEGEHIELPVTLIVALIFFVVSLSCDLLHFAWGSFIWGKYARSHEKREIDGREVVRPDDDHIPDPDPKINWPSIFLFWMKLLCVAIGAFCITANLSSRITGTFG